MSGDGTLVTVVMPVFRKKPFLEPALRSIFAQDYSPLQIAISDDASPDDAFDLVSRLASDYRGPHRIVLNRNARNLGMGNYNKLMRMAEARFVVMAHDDDISEPDRVRRLAEVWKFRRVSMVSSNARRIDADGKEIGLHRPASHDQPVSLRTLAKFGTTNTVLGATLSWDREVFDFFGDVDAGRSFATSDFILPFRAALLRGVHFVDEPLVRWRVHDRQRHIANQSDDPSANKADSQAGFLGQFAYLIDTLDEFRRKAPLRAVKTFGLRRQMSRKIEQLAGALGRSRSRLQAEGKVHRWIKRP